MSVFAKIVDDIVTELNVFPDDPVAQQEMVAKLGGTWIKSSGTPVGNVLGSDVMACCKNHANIDDTYDAARQAFIAPQLYPSWILNEDTCQYEPPTPMPDDGARYSWDEVAGDWVAA